MSRFSKKVSNKNELDLTQGNLLGKILLFTIPIMLSGILQLLFNAADMAVVGRFCGKTSLAAVGANGSMVTLLTNLFIGLSVGANVVAAQHVGAGRTKELEDTVHTAMAVSLISGVFVMVLGITISKQALIWMQTPNNIIDLADLYLKIYFLSMPAMMVYNFGAALLRSVGDTKRPLFFLTAAGIINVLLNLLFVIVFKMDVAGVALATVCSQYISAALIVTCLVKSGGSVTLDIKKLKIKKDALWAICKIGLPSGLYSSLFSISNVIIQASINSFGDTVISGNTAACSIEGFVYTSMNAFAATSLTFTGQNLGAKKYERINKILLTAEACVIVVGAIMGNVAYLFSDKLLSIYSSEPEVIAVGVTRMSIVSVTYFLCGMMDVIVGSIRGLGYSLMPMIVSLLGACGPRLFWIFTFFRQERFHTLQSLFITYPVSWILTIIAHVICFTIIRKKMNRRLRETGNEVRNST